MKFIETPIFSRVIQGLLPDAEYRALQCALILRPEQGVLIKGSGGLRKIRWRAPNRGKRSGLRIVYYWHEFEESFYMLWAYSKAGQEDLSPKQLRALSRIVREEFK